MRKAAILALPDCTMTGLGALLDLCRLANRYTGELFAANEGPLRAMQTYLLTRDGADVRFADGRRMRADGAADGDEIYDVVYVVSFEVKSGAELERRLALLKKDVCPWLRRQRLAGARIAAAGVGVLVLAEAGLLDDAEAALPSEYAAIMGRRFAKVRFDGASTIAHWRGLHTAAVVGAEPSLAIRLLADAFSQNLADHLIKITGISASEVALEAPALDLSEDDVVRRAQVWLQQRFTQKVKIAALAVSVAVSQKSLNRRFKAALNMTPQAYLQQLRIEAAKRQLLHTDRRVDRIAALVGYADLGFFQEKFRAHTGMLPTAFRAAARNSEIERP